MKALFYLIVAAQIANAHAQDSNCAVFLAPPNGLTALPRAEALEALAKFLGWKNSEPTAAMDLKGSVAWKETQFPKGESVSATSDEAQLLFYAGRSSDLSLPGLDFTIDSARAYGQLRNLRLGESNLINGLKSPHADRILLEIQNLESQIHLTPGQRQLIRDWEDLLKDQVYLWSGPKQFIIKKHSVSLSSWTTVILRKNGDGKMESASVLIEDFDPSDRTKIVDRNSLEFRF
ncbi:MAG: hypothetical protein AB7F86_05085 [Bdellovibrionales bacterium]